MMQNIKKIVKVIRNEESIPVYDIQTKKNHNFFAGNTLVHNCILYQESLQLIYHKLAGMPLDETDMVRKAFTKKDKSNKEKAKADREKLRIEFIQRCKEANNIDEETSNEIFEEMEKYVSYSFNKSLSEDTLVLIKSKNQNDNKFVAIPISQVEPGDIVLSRNEANKETIETKVVARHDHGVQHVFDVFLDDGRKVRTTLDHKFRTTDGQMLPLFDIMTKGLEIESL